MGTAVASPSLIDRVVAADGKHYQKTVVVVVVVALSVLWAQLLLCQIYGHSWCPVLYGYGRLCPVSFMGIAGCALSILWAQLASGASQAL